MRIFSHNTHKRSKNAKKADKSGEALQYLMPAEADAATGAQAGYAAEYYRVKLLAHRLRKARAKGQQDFDSFATERSLANFAKLRGAVKKVMADNRMNKAAAPPVIPPNTKLKQLKSTLAAKADERDLKKTYTDDEINAELAVVGAFHTAE